MRAYEMQAHDVVGRCRRSLMLSDGQESIVDIKLVGALLRRAAGIYCPCSRATLGAAAIDCLRYCDADQNHLSDLVDSAIDGLLVVGDLLELTDVTVGDLPATGTWVFAAPPAFVVRPSGTLFLLGVVADQETFLPPSLNDRIAYNNVVRVMSAVEDENLAANLKELGFMEILESSWLKGPRPTDSFNILTRIHDALARQNRAPAITDLSILDASKSVSYYRGRWTSAADHVGVYVARRPQEYGYPIWCVVDLFGDGTMKVLDLPHRKSRWRGCDAAWHIQMAIDANKGTPQRYSTRRMPGSVEITFYSPIPQWAEIGRASCRERV